MKRHHSADDPPAGAMSLVLFIIFNFFAFDASPIDNSKLTRQDKVVVQSSLNLVDFVLDFGKQSTSVQQYIPMKRTL